MAVPRVKVMVAHGIPLVRAGLEAALRQQGDFEILSPGAASTCKVPEQRLLNSVSVVVTDCDIGMAVSGRSSGCRVLIVTNDDTEASIRRAMEVGTHGYLLLTSTLDAVVRAVRCVISGGTVKAVRAKLNVTSRTEAVAVAQRRGLVPKGIAIRRPGPAAGEKGYPAAPLHQQPSVARVWSEMTAAAKSQTRRIA
jgi:DNA-binding NarL/FixJ family response regulator